MPNEKLTLNIVLGAVEVTAKLRDGTTKPVKVRQLPIRELVEKWGPSQGDEAGLVELYCSEEKGWDDQLLAESHDEILRVGGELNRPTFARWAGSRRAEIADFKEMTKGLVPESTFPTLSSPAPSSSEKLPVK